MMKRWFALTAVVLLAIAPTVRAQEKHMVVVRVQPIDKLLQSAEYLAALADQGEQAKQFLGIIEAMTTENGLEGIDTKRPIGLIVDVSESELEPRAVGLIPVADEESFLNFFGRFGITFEKGDDDVYTLNVPSDEPVYFRFAQKYVCITAQSKSNIDPKTLPKITDALKSDDSALASLVVNIDQIPQEVHDLVLGQMEMAVAEAKSEPLDDDVPPSVGKLRDVAIDSAVGGFKMVLTEASQLRLSLAVDPEKDELGVRFSFSAQKGTELEKKLQSWGNKKSAVLGGLRKQGNAYYDYGNLALPDSVIKALGPAIDDAYKELTRQVIRETDLDPDALQQALKALMPTVKAGELDVGGAFHGPNDSGHYTVLVGAKVQEGKAIEKAVQKLASSLPGEVQGIFRFNVGKAGDVTLHQVIPPPHEYPEEAAAILGSPLNVFLGTAQNRIWLAFGEDAKEVLSAAAKEPAVSSPIAVNRASVRPFVELIEATGQEGIKEIADKTFSGAAEDADTVSTILEGGKELRGQFTIKGKVITFLARVGMNATRGFE